MEPVRDSLTEKFIQCPECKTWSHTYPTEGVPEQSLRTCADCGYDFLFDHEHGGILTEIGLTAENKGQNFLIIHGWRYAYEYKRGRQRRIMWRHPVTQQIFSQTEAIKWARKDTKARKKRMQK